MQFNLSPLFLDFLAGNQTYSCSPWSIADRQYFGWQRPCYLLGEGFAKSYTELMETTTGTPTAPAITKNAPTAWSIAAMRRGRRRARSAGR